MTDSRTEIRENASSPAALGLAPSFGFGDRLGCATPGHLAALKESGQGISGIFAQQSIREMARTQRTAPEVMQAAVSALQAAHYAEAWGADADHLKTEEDVRITAAAGFVFYTIDPSGFVDQRADDYDLPTLETHVQDLADEVRWIRNYEGQTIRIPAGPQIVLDRLAVLRAAVKYGRAITKTAELARFIASHAESLGQPWEIELSVDETDQPTSLAEHFIIADQLRRREVALVSLAPRFIGEMEKGIDYRGDLQALAVSLRDHAAIARELGPYKLSLHSGSDKLSMYGLLAQATQGMFHVKTAGTSYLEALRVVARCAPEEFRRIIQFSRERYDVDKATYHVSATVDGVPAPEQLSTPLDIERCYLELWEDVPAGKGFTTPGRQILHCTFGSVLTDPTLGPLVKQILRENQTTYDQVLQEHFSRHLQALQA